MKEKLFALFWVLFLALPLYAQADKTGSYSIKGQVLDSLSNESVPYATLRIAFAKTPEKPVKLLACDVDGKFQAPLSSAGKYIISMQSIGKAPAEKIFTISDKQRNLDLGKLYMQEDNQRLGEVTVTAQKPLVKAEIDKLTYSLEDDPEAQTNNTLDMLRKVPMVTVDGDDQIQLKGSTNFKIYMNGKPSNLLSNNPAEVLKSMPANSVKNIEVITDPGAKYDAEGIGGIINIITTKNALQGYTGTVRVNGSSLGRVGGGGYVSLKAGKLGLTANYNYNRERDPWNDANSVREDLQNDGEHFLTQNGRRKSRGPFQFGYLEGSYEIDSLNLLTVGANLFRGEMKSFSEYNVNMQDINHNPVYSYNRNSETTETFGSTDVNVDYQHSTHKKDELLTVSYRFSHSPNDSKDYTELENVVNYNPWLGYPQNNINKASTNEHTGQVDYTTPTWKDQTLEVGAKYIFRQSRSNTDRTAFNDSLNIWEDVTSKDSHFRHTQHIYSAYLGYSMKFDKFGVKAGVRAEGTSLDVKYEMAPDMNFDTHYFDVVPNATISYQLSMAQQLRLGYNMTYPFWHPSGRYITTSVNDIKQFFHSVKEKKMEVFDLESDVVVYDVKNKEILSKASLITKDAFETFPAFSPDGKWLYFCTAPAQKMPENYDKVRYNLCRVAFDPDRGEISFPIDTLVHADSLSYTFPRISPDGRFLMYTETAYGQFPIWHPDAEIRMMDLENRTAMDMSALNSPDTDSYHSWSSNSDWVVFSSRRDNGLYTLPYICYIGKDGKPSKPFLLPQEDPDKYDYQLYSYNIPELTKGAVEVSPYEIQQVAEKNKPEQVRFK